MRVCAVFADFLECERAVFHVGCAPTLVSTQSDLSFGFEAFLTKLKDKVQARPALRLTKG